VQGQGAAAEIAAGIRELNRFPEIDVMIVGRGGGSLEDLWAFNEEIVAQAIFASRIPVISAVGHEVDFTIADFVADLRAPTPSAAAELVISQKNAMLEQVAMLENRLQQSFQFRLTQLNNQVLALSADRVFASVDGRLGYYRQRLDELSFRLASRLHSRLGELKGRERLLAADFGRFDLQQMLRLKHEKLGSQFSRLQAGTRLFLQSARGEVQALDNSLHALSPLAVLQRGYAICRDVRGTIVKEVTALSTGDLLSVRLAKGTVDARAEKIHEA
jgi:exodeoxyribonuclease VII large subunit